MVIIRCIRPLDEICTDLRPCVTLNCPWGRYPKLDKANKYKYHTCKTIDSLRRTRRPSASHVETYSPHKDDKIDHLLNVTFNFAVGSSINNIKFKYPNRPLYEGAKYLEECEFESLYDVPTEGAECTADRRRLMWTYHTAHLHGHDMFLIDMGFPETYKNGSIKSMSKFLKCDNPACTMHQWKEDKIAKRVNFDRPIQKNTILLPAQGYAIVRFKATNPGWWPLHCHNALHNMEGMMLLFHVDDEEHGRPLTTIPRGLPQCSPQQSSRRAEQLYPWEIEPNFNW
ncbi:unnamed protein product [Oikopleura dioica]|uniref:ferroxidase n=1 Tax=Oikopleura dioica TaxID=34765 RepID=E4XNY7_OIKDI|nr:unnamed protein product [Oikopleura dioica]